jgi:hypothetical protein
MKKIFSLVLLVTVITQLKAQKTSNPLNRAKDHLVIQFTGDSWANKPDSIVTKKLNRGANIYVMMDYPFKSNKNFSLGIGAGFGTSGVFLKKTNAAILGTTTNLIFRKLDSVNHFKKYKVATAFLEAPIELRWTKNPENYDKSLKAALGIKIGTLLSAYTKGKTLQNASDNDLNKNIEKLKSKNYFNSSRIALTARIGIGHWSIFGQYQLTNVFKDNIAPPVKPYSIGIMISGL